jgi:hypothetical protein
MMLIKSKLVYELHRALAFERAGEKTEIGAVVFIDQIASMGSVMTERQGRFDRLHAQADRHPEHHAGARSDLEPSS